jgi:hypothetical protein
MANGFDMKKTIEWYRDSGITLPNMSLTESMPITIANTYLLNLSHQEIAGLYNLFPENARRRNVVDTITGKSGLYFHRNSTMEDITTTLDSNEAISPTAIVPSYIGYSGTGRGHINLYKLLSNLPESVKSIISSQGLVHELSHGIIHPTLDSENYPGYSLKFSDGKIVSGVDAMIEFAEMTEKHQPISLYASLYRKDFSNPDSGSVFRAIREDCAETIAAYLLGFAYCEDDQRSGEPFADRPEIKEFVRNFLEAKLVEPEK